MLLDQTMHWRVVPGVFQVMVGSSSSDILLESRLQVQSESDLAE
jgi:hypothetical protein